MDEEIIIAYFAICEIEYLWRWKELGNKVYWAEMKRDCVGKIIGFGEESKHWISPEEQAPKKAKKLRFSGVHVV